jgi:PAS domain S-box-containing protein
MEEVSLSPKKILVVEDEPEIRAGTVRLLSRTGYQVFEADNGERGWEAVLAVRPDLVLSDVAMPVLDGIELCRRVRAHPEVKTTLFMFLSSARTQSNEQADGLDVGADGYIARPVSNRELLSRMSALIRIVEANARANEVSARAAQRERLARLVLESLNDPASTKDAIRDILRSIKGARDFGAVAIRLREDGDFPYYESSGFPEEFVRRERFVCARDKSGAWVRDAQGNPVLDCMCGDVLSGGTDPALPYFTQAGSFWCNSQAELLTALNRKGPEARERNRCCKTGYESIALIPLHVGGEVIGLLQINDHRQDQFTPDLIQYLEGLSASIGIALGRKRAEEALRESQARLSLALLSAQMGVWQWDIAGDRVHFDERVCRHLGLDSTSYRGTTAEFLAAVHPDDRERVASYWAGALAREMPQALEYRVVWPDGSVHHIDSCGGRTFDPSGRPLRVDGILWDISERKRVEEEKERLQARLAQAQKMESVGVLAGGVAHEYNNMLAVILGHTELAIDKLDPTLPIRGNLEQVCKAARRSADLTRQLLAYARRQTIAPKILDLNEPVSRALTEFKPMLSNAIQLDWRPGARLWPVNVDPTQIEQILSKQTYIAATRASSRATPSAKTCSSTIKLSTRVAPMARSKK